MLQGRSTRSDPLTVTRTRRRTALLAMARRKGVGKRVMALLVAIEAPRQEDTIPLDMIASKIVEAKPLQLDGDRPRLPRRWTTAPAASAANLVDPIRIQLREGVSGVRRRRSAMTWWGRQRDDHRGGLRVCAPSYLHEPIDHPGVTTPVTGSTRDGLASSRRWRWRGFRVGVALWVYEWHTFQLGELPI
jgi:hypothetical protein